MVVIVKKDKNNEVGNQCNTLITHHARDECTRANHGSLYACDLLEEDKNFKSRRSRPLNTQEVMFKSSDKLGISI